jgi:hypothetical protein
VNPGRRARTIAVSLALALAASAAAPFALAQPGAKADDEAGYKSHMTNGVKLYQDRNWEAAIAEFEAAYRIKPKASPLVNIALCHKGMFNYPKAIGVLETALGKHADTLTPADKKAAEDAITDMKALLGYVTLELSPANATVSVDGADLPKDAASKPIPLGPGTHQIAARAEGYATQEQSVTVASGEKDKKVVLKLTPDKGYVTIRAVDAQTAIAIDQKAMGYGSWAGFLAPGTHLVQMYKPGNAQSYSVQIVVAAGKSQDVKEGVGGSLVTGPTGAPTGKDKDKDEGPPQPQVRGFYGFLTGTVYGVTSVPTGTEDASVDPGFAGGLRFGYRAATILGLELMFQYGASGGGDGSTRLQGTTVIDEGYAVKSLRMGGNVRLMTKGKTVRFVGTLGGGVAYDAVSFDEALNAARDAEGATGYLLLEPGLELEFSRFVVGAALSIIPTFSRGGERDAGGNAFGNTFAQAGLQLRAGYGFW